MSQYLLIIKICLQKTLILNINTDVYGINDGYQG